MKVAYSGCLIAVQTDSKLSKHIEFKMNVLEAHTAIYFLNYGTNPMINCDVIVISINDKAV